jgi:hypothetical protein
MKNLAALILSASLSVAGPTLWRDPGPIETLDLIGGPGGRENQPQPPFAFMKEEVEGTSPKIQVRDARGRLWSVKFGPEVKAENFAVRMAWAAGYFGEPTYFVREGVVEGARGLGRTAQYVDGSGRFRDARFELRDEKYRIVAGEQWTLTDKAIANTKELSGLRLVLMLVANWDVKPDNLAVMETGGQRFYAVTDWGATMGRAGDIGDRSKWSCEDYTAQSGDLVQGANEGLISFRFTGKERDVIGEDMEVSHVKWFMDRFGKVREPQVRAALQASGATPAETECFTRAVMTRLNAFARAAASPPGPGRSTTTETIIKKKTTTVREQQ